MSARSLIETANTWAYHVTLASFLPSIRAQGLLPRYSEPAGEDVIFVEPDEAEAAIYAEPGTVMLRFPVDGFGSTDDGETVIHGSVAPELIQMKRGEGWVTIS